MKPGRTTTVLSKHQILLLLLLTLVFVAACSPQAVKTTENTYKKAVKLEYEQKAARLMHKGPPMPSWKARQEQINAYYRDAVKEAEKAVSLNANDPELLTRLYAVQALSYWRLKKYAEAGTAREKAIENYHRSQNKNHNLIARIEALPALITNDQDFNRVRMLSREKKMGHLPDPGTVKQLTDSYVAGMRTIDDTIKKNPAINETTRGALLMDRLTLYANYTHACGLYDKDLVEDACIRKEICPARLTYKRLKRTPGVDPELLSSIQSQWFAGYGNFLARCPQ